MRFLRALSVGVALSVHGFKGAWKLNRKDYNIQILWM